MWRRSNCPLRRPVVEQAVRSDPDTTERRSGALIGAGLVVALGCLAAVAIIVGGSDPSGAVAIGSDVPRAANAGGTMADMSMPLGDPPRWSDGTIAAPTRWIGPQGGFGQFVAECLYSHSGEVDPIVWPGTVGRSHRHDFYGATTTDQNSTPDSLRAGGTTCDKPGDNAAYWQPTLYDGDTAVQPVAIHAYYRAAPGIAPVSVHTFPDGLMMLAGDPFAAKPQPGEAAGWSCGVRMDLSDTPPDCPETAPLVMVLTFPDCWNGIDADVPGHRDHMTYSRQGACPADHPVSVPQLTVSIKFPITGPGHQLRLASGTVYSAHGDFFNGWHPEALQREITQCIHKGAVCDLGSNRQEKGPFFTR